MTGRQREWTAPPPTYPQPIPRHNTRPLPRTTPAPPPYPAVRPTVIEQTVLPPPPARLPAPAAPPAAPVLPAHAVPPARQPLVAESEPVRISVDNNRCRIYGICQQEAPEVFRISGGGSLHYTGKVPADRAAQARQAVRCCPMQAIAIKGAAPGADVVPHRTRSGSATRDRLHRIVIVGGGLAAVSAANRLRDRGFDDEVVIVGEETRRPYSRPPLSKQFLAGELTADQLTFRAERALDAHWLTGTRVTGIDVAERTLELPGGESLPYDGLIVATGVDARRLPEAPVFSDRVRTIRTLADATAVQAWARGGAGQRLAIVGGGFVGCELALTARTLGMDVTLIVQSAPLLGRVLGADVGGVVNRIQERAGVDVRLGTKIDGWADTTTGLRLKLDDGDVLETDLAVLGIGSAPRTEWLRGSGLDVKDGVLCAPTCHVIGPAGAPLPNVVAAGDVARWPNARYDDTPRRVEHLINAVEMGQHAAESLLRGPHRARPFTPVPRFWSDQHGHRLQACGSPALGKDVEIVEGSLRSERFVARYTRETGYGRQIVAAVAFDMPLELLAYRDDIGRTLGARPRTPRRPR
ncbi:3-phenylpropionate/cinnamic acid dioxygenase ferredoxin--NAD(+) reductase component [Streptomyces sp. RB5]|uniref:3-phenylpropionate/cinnamic acid dioxygenase ferredoxin--NAD(+) reductase component n=1 Tax=Streptomyces smaragdinus TaxID=2585196 RepID=A0A7K0CNK5_9ACTN|nr:FAD-dependent oxidoreductase [Streptomyces smaragdinus]MQY14344.1 3-phenylpropionate/cinnamic acid dioxygenase ferredoxin--NAD(+) reductase component [Streptomyces smaragdinus]